MQGRHRYLAFVFMLVGSASVASAQQLPGRELTDFIQATERFGWKLLKEVHAANPIQNVALSPLPVSYIFGAISQGSVTGQTKGEINRAFDGNPALRLRDRVVFCTKDSGRL
jgi:hypothetical protein